MLNDVDELPAEPLEDGEEDEDDPLLPEGEVALLLPDELLPIEPDDEEPAATAAPETADNANAKSTALLRNFMKRPPCKKS